MTRYLLLLLLLLPLSLRAEVYDDMYQAIERDNVADVRQILQLGLAVDTSDKDGDSLLMTAIRSGSDHVAEFLLPLAGMGHVNRFGETPLMLAAYFGKVQLTEKMLQRGANLNGAGNWSPLSYAAFRGQLEIVRLLLRYGANMESPSDNGTTALMAAALNGHIAVVKLLLDYGADPLALNEAGEDAISFALRHGNTDIVALLQQQIKKNAGTAAGQR